MPSCSQEKKRLQVGLKQHDLVGKVAKGAKGPIHGFHVHIKDSGGFRLQSQDQLSRDIEMGTDGEPSLSTS